MTDLQTNDEDVGVVSAQIAVQASIESQVSTQSKPYTAAAFFHFRATGSLERHRVIHAAYEADAFAIDF